ncbi:hypothetical protein H0H92_000619 [Tricholoma furcatifolium]|nr:hypothetical protein H0H92_000619 [Tricholoma furcatifolium]
MTLFEFSQRRTRSGATFSPFEVRPVKHVAFDLALSVKNAAEDVRHSDVLQGRGDDLASGASGQPFDGQQTPTHTNSPDPPPAPPQPAESTPIPPLKRSSSSVDAPEAGGCNARVHKRRRAIRDAGAPLHGHHPPRAEVIAEHVRGATAIWTDVTRDVFPAASTGFTGLSGKASEQGWGFQSLQEALDAGYELIKWDGRTCVPLQCKEGRVFAVLVGQPDCPGYAAACTGAYDAIAQEAGKERFNDNETHHKRGDFPAVNVGVTMGPGSHRPSNVQSGAHSAMLRRLLANRDIIRLANFTDAAFNLWAPNVHKKYRDHLDPLFQHHRDLRRIFPRSVYTAAAFNFGPNVYTKAHHDVMNIPIGLCAIQALGRFDPTRGGHIVLPELGLVIEFPPGALILIPSATLTHLNIPVGEQESRASFTQYCAGGLFRYTENRFRTDKDLQDNYPEEYARLSKLRENRWQEDYKLYSYLDELVHPVA